MYSMWVNGCVHYVGEWVCTWMGMGVYMDGCVQYVGGCVCTVFGWMGVYYKMLPISVLSTHICVVYPPAVKC